MHRKILVGALALSLLLPALPIRAAVPLLASTIRSLATETTATLFWQTELPSRTRVVFTTTPQAPVWNEYQTDELVTAHVATLLNLTPQHTYYFHIRTDDGVGNVSDDKKESLFSTFYTGELNTVAALQTRLTQLQAQLAALQATGVLAVSTTPYDVVNPSSFTRTLKVGDRGDDVRALQEKLNQIGITVPATGYFGPLTVAAVARFAVWAYFWCRNCRPGYAGCAAHDSGV
jgi:Putative peptidoglycan binding domain